VVYSSSTRAGNTDIFRARVSGGSARATDNTPCRLNGPSFRRRGRHRGLKVTAGHPARSISWGTNRWRGGMRISRSEGRFATPVMVTRAAMLIDVSPKQKNQGRPIGRDCVSNGSLGSVCFHIVIFSMEGPSGHPMGADFHGSTARTRRGLRGGIRSIP